MVLEAGGGALALSWFMVQPLVAQSAQVCTYDRAGLGWSDAGPEPRDGVYIAQDLHALLTADDRPGPYVLVGHSYGGLYIRAFAEQFPAEVAGLVLLDSAHPDQWTRTPEGQARYASDAGIYSVARILVRFGLLRVGPNPFAATPDDWPDEVRAEWRALVNTTTYWDTTDAEARAIVDTMTQLRAAPALLDQLPLAVVTAGLNTGVEGRWPEYQAELAALSSNSLRAVVPDAGHESLWADPVAAQASADAILQVVAAARSGELLPAP